MTEAELAEHHYKLGRILWTMGGSMRDDPTAARAHFEAASKEECDSQVTPCTPFLASPSSSVFSLQSWKAIVSADEIRVTLQQFMSICLGRSQPHRMIIQACPVQPALSESCSCSMPAHSSM